MRYRELVNEAPDSHVDAIQNVMNRLLPNEFNQFNLTKEELLEIAHPIFNAKYPNTNLYVDENEALLLTTDASLQSSWTGGNLEADENGKSALTLTVGANIGYYPSEFDGVLNSIWVGDGYSGDYKGVIQLIIKAIYEYMESKLDAAEMNKFGIKVKRQMDVSDDRTRGVWQRMAKACGATYATSSH